MIEEVMNQVILEWIARGDSRIERRNSINDGVIATVQSRDTKGRILNYLKREGVEEAFSLDLSGISRNFVMTLARERASKRPIRSIIETVTLVTPTDLEMSTVQDTISILAQDELLE